MARVGCSVRVAELADPVDDVEPARHLADDRVVRRQRGVVRRDDEELAARRARRLGGRLRHRDDAVRVRRVLRHLVVRRVARPAGARPGRVAALDHEARDDPVEERVVEEAALRERDERAGRVRRRLLVERDREVPAVRLEDEAVCLARLELLVLVRQRAVVGAALSRPSSRPSAAASSLPPAVVRAVVPPPQPASTRTSRSGARRFTDADLAVRIRHGTSADPLCEERRRQHRLPGDRRRPVRPRARSRILLASRGRLGTSGLSAHHRAPRPRSRA